MSVRINTPRGISCTRIHNKEHQPYQSVRLTYLRPLVGRSTSSTAGASYSRVGDMAAAADLSSVPGQLSYFILKAKKRAVIDDSTARAAWALQNHKSDRAGNNMAPSNPQQPHHRLQAARARGGVVLLFAVDEWVGYALMGPGSWLDESKPFPNHFSLNWKLQLPRTHGVPVSRRHWLAAQY